MREPPRASPWELQFAPLGQMEQWHFDPASMPNGHPVPTCRSGSLGANPATTFSSPCPNGASHTSPGCKPWGSTRQHSSRSEGTPHNLRVSDIDPALPMRCSYRTHLFFGLRFPGRCLGFSQDAPLGLSRRGSSHGPPVKTGKACPATIKRRDSSRGLSPLDSNPATPMAPFPHSPTG